jgi:hypothetical protein
VSAEAGPSLAAAFEPAEDVALPLRNRRRFLSGAVALLLGNTSGERMGREITIEIKVICRRQRWEWSCFRKFTIRRRTLGKKYERSFRATG